MKFNGVHKSLYFLFIGLVLFVGIGFSFMLMKAHRESKIFKQNEKNLEEALGRAQKERNMREEYLKRFREDPEFVEWVARQRIGYASSDEIIFRFGEDDASLDSYKK